MHHLAWWQMSGVLIVCWEEQAAIATLSLLQRTHFQGALKGAGASLLKSMREGEKGGGGCVLRGVTVSV